MGGGIKMAMRGDRVDCSYGFLIRKKEMRKSEILSAGLSTAAYLLLACFSMPAPANEAIWIEGEDYNTSTFVETQGAGSWYHNDKITKDLLSPGVPGVSDGDWHSH
jgi:hypothetical protein